jgi:hypothetical protein
MVLLLLLFFTILFVILITSNESFTIYKYIPTNKPVGDVIINYSVSDLVNNIPAYVKFKAV